ncbi:hypothetical protein R1flu_023475 [Riccia fluitans]|uniref:HMG box domain-containing protein n=1 Tax=Riccia fluitans TaxID=41844 RepID=A0ABD1XS54_9MARC
MNLSENRSTQKNLTWYNFFFGEERLRLKQTGATMGLGEVAKAIGSAWRSLSPEEKKEWGNLPRVNATFLAMAPLYMLELAASAASMCWDDEIIVLSSSDSE